MGENDFSIKLILMIRNSICLISLFSLTFCERENKTNGPYFGNGIKNGWADQNSIVIWTRLTKLEDVSVAEVRKLYEFMPKRGSKALLKKGAMKTLDLIDPQSLLDFGELVFNHGLQAHQELPAPVVVNMSTEDILYMQSVVKRGEDLLHPRINLSTIHRMKGGEDDNVILLTDSSYPAVKNPNQDDEHRVFYTGVTRAKQNLHIIDSYSKYRYNI